MPVIIPIKDLKDTNSISKLAHESNEPIFVTKKRCNDLVIMSAELYGKLFETDHIDKAIRESEEMQNKSKKSIKLDKAFKTFDEKYFKGL